MGYQSAILRLAAAAVGLVALTLTTSTLFSGQAASVEATQIQRAKSNMFSMVQNLELDFRNLGSGVTPDSTFPLTPIDTLACELTAGAYCRFRFAGRVDPATPRASAIEYRWKKTDSATVEPDGPEVQLYVVTRLVDEKLRASMDRVTRFRLTFMDASGLQTDNLDTTRRIDVELNALVPTTSGSNHLKEVAWRHTFTPGNLRRERAVPDH